MIYIASPYSHPDQIVRGRRYDEVMAITARLIEGGIHAMSPIVHSHEMAERHNMKGDFDFWHGYCLTMLDSCSAMIVVQLPGWNASAGVKVEMQHAIKTGKQVIIIDGSEPVSLIKARIAAGESYNFTDRAPQLPTMPDHPEEMLLDVPEIPAYILRWSALIACVAIVVATLAGVGTM